MTNRRILLLGAPRIERDRAWVTVERRKAVALLAYLVVSGQETARETLAAMFWPDAQTGRGLAYLRTTLWTINSALGEDWARLDGGLVGFNHASGIDDDVRAFRAHLRGGTPDNLVAAAALYRADFLHGFSLPDAPVFEEWAFFQAEALRRELAGTLAQLTEHQHTQGNIEAAITTARHWLALDTLHEPAHRTLWKRANPQATDCPRSRHRLSGARQNWPRSARCWPKPPVAC